MEPPPNLPSLGFLVLWSEAQVKRLKLSDRNVDCLGTAQSNRLYERAHGHANQEARIGGPRGPNLTGVKHKLDVRALPESCMSLSDVSYAKMWSGLRCDMRRRTKSRNQ